MSNQSPRKICFVLTSFIHYSRNFLILDELRERSDIDLHIIIGGTALVSRYTSKSADVESFLRADGHTNIYKAHFSIEGDSEVVKAKTTGLAISELASLYLAIEPDVVLVRGDRFEVLAAVIAAAYMNITIAHIEGGDLSGTIDESVRHAITKMAHLHFTTNAAAKARVLKMGERPDFVFNFGSPDIEVVLRAPEEESLDLSNTGSGKAEIDINEEYLTVMFHPVTSETDKLAEQTKILLDAVVELGVPTFWFWPNADTGAEKISSVLRIFNDKVKDHNIKFTRYLPPRSFIHLVRHTKCFVGNSSAGIKECSVLGVPVVNIGSRQANRLKTHNIFEVDFEKTEISNAISSQLQHGKYDPDHTYQLDDTAKNMAKTLATTPLQNQKKFHEV